MLDLGRQIERYTLEALLGSGGQGDVYRVRHMQLGTHHALKVVSGSLRMRERLLQEGRAQAKLRHPNIVAVTDVIDVDGDAGLIMEFVAGPTLSQVLLHERLTLEQIDLLARGIFAGVAHAHSQRFIHRDLKPDNILCAITPAGLVPKIMDFGLVKALGADQQDPGMRATRSGTVMGTAHYMSPEQVRSTRDVDERTDIWALGVILYEMATRTLPFDGADLFEIFAAVTRGTHTPPLEHRPELPDRMVAAIEAALVTEMDQRVADVEALRQMWFQDTPPPARRRHASAKLAGWDQELLGRYALDSLPEPEPSGQHATWVEPSMTDDLAPETYSLSELEEPQDTRSRAPVVPFLFGGALALLGAAALTFVAIQLGTNSDLLADDPVAVHETREEAPREAAAVPPSKEAELQTESPPSEEEPQPIEAPKPAPEPKAKPTAKAAAGPSAPKPRAAPTATAVPSPAPAEPAEPSIGSFVLLGGLEGGDVAYLAPADGSRYRRPNSELAAGTYTLFFGVGGGTPERVESVTVKEGQGVTARCDRGSGFCSVTVD